MESSYTRREIMRRCAWAVPAFHMGLGSSTVVQALVAMSERPNRFRSLRLAAQADRLEFIKAFYRDTLNLPIVDERADGLNIQAGGTCIDFRADDSGASPFYHVAFNIPENKLEPAIDWMSHRAPLLKNRQGNHIVYFDWLEAHSIYFYDPAGNLLEFIAHHSLKNEAGGAFNERDILYASEIGLVTEDVPGLGAEIESSIGLTNYAVKRGLRSSDEFRPIGDPHGFFIVVKHKRPWLMSEVPAEMFPVLATLRGPSTSELRLKHCDCALSVIG